MIFFRFVPPVVPIRLRGRGGARGEVGGKQGFLVRGHVLKQGWFEGNAESGKEKGKRGGRKGAKGLARLRR